MYQFNFPTALTQQEIQCIKVMERCEKLKALFDVEKTKEDAPKRPSKSGEPDGVWKPKKRNRLSSDRISIGENSAKRIPDLEDGEILDDDDDNDDAPMSPPVPNCSVIVRGMDLSEDKLRKAFKQNGDLICGKTTVDNKQKTATIHFRNQAEVDKAVSKMNGYILNGISIRVVVDRSSERMMQHTSITINTTQKKPKEEKVKVDKKGAGP